MCPSGRGARRTCKVYPQNLKHLQGPRGESMLWCCADGATVVPWCMTRVVVGRKRLVIRACRKGFILRECNLSTDKSTGKVPFRWCYLALSHRRPH